MKVLKIIEEIAEMTPENIQSQSRDEAIKNMGNWGKKLAMAAIPTSLLMLAFQEKARAATGGTAPSAAAIGAVLNFALKLEYLESTFYTLAVAANNGSGSNVTQTGQNGNNSTYQATSGYIGSTDIAIFEQIQKHEAAHVNLLLSALSGIGIQAVAKPDFDFTGGHSLSHSGGLFSPFTNYQDFLTLSQAFEDTGVRAYKGQAPNLQFSTVLTTALQIHSVEARHASEVRRLRTEKGWITSSNTTLTPTSVFAAVYLGDDNLTQGGVNVYSNSQVFGVSQNAATEAFDEPLDMQSVLNIAGLMIV
jgi:hypothetical protein